MTDWYQIAGRIAAASGEPFDPLPPRGIGGGCINEAVRLSDSASIGPHSTMARALSESGLSRSSRRNA